jgi:hypothetical protein
MISSFYHTDNELTNKKSNFSIPTTKRPTIIKGALLQCNYSPSQRSNPSSTSMILPERGRGMGKFHKKRGRFLTPFQQIH